MRLDLFVNDSIILEIKSIQKLLLVHEAQLLINRSLLEKPQGLFINFFTDNIAKSIKTVVIQQLKNLNET